jgi:hypothetical protein
LLRDKISKRIIAAIILLLAMAGDVALYLVSLKGEGATDPQTALSITNGLKLFSAGLLGFDLARLFKKK